MAKFNLEVYFLFHYIINIKVVVLGRSSVYCQVNIYMAHRYLALFLPPLFPFEVKTLKGR